MACISIFSAVALSIVIILLLKSLHDTMRARHEPLIQRYIEIAGRITALYVGTVSVDMIMQGIQTWADKF